MINLTIFLNSSIKKQILIDVVLSDSGGVGSVLHSGGSSEAVEGASDHVSNRLQRAKAGSRKTFKFRKTRKDVSIDDHKNCFHPLQNYNQ